MKSFQKCLTLEVIASLLLLSATMPTFAVESRVAPLATEDCDSIAKTLGNAIGIQLTTSVGTPTILNSIHGSACIISGQATGLTVDFLNAQNKLDAALPGWRHVNEFDADGPYSTVKGFTKGSQSVVYSLAIDPPEGSCPTNLPISKCKVPQKRWTWKVDAVGFIQ
jgi:hypothetical protein